MRPLAAIGIMIAVACAARAEGPRPKVARPAVVAPIIIDGERVGSAWVFPSAQNDQLLVEAESLLTLLDVKVKSSLLDAIEAKQTIEGTVTKADVESAGFKVSFDDRSLFLSVEIPADARQGEEYDFGRRKRISGKLYEQAPVSGILNARGAITNSSVGGEEKWEAFQGSLESVTRVQDFLLLTGVESDLRAQTPYRRSETRLVYDLPAIAFRSTLGDLEPQLTGFQTALSIGGIGASRNFSLAGANYRNITLVSRSEINVDRPSEIDVLVNGVSFTRLRVSPGPVTLSHLPLSSGLNDVVLNVRDDLGRTEVIRLTYLLDLGLLDQGVHEFSYQAGYATRARAGGEWEERDYETEKPRVSLFHRYGASTRWTLGLNYQSSEKDFIAGGEARWISAVGLLSFDGAVSQVGPSQSAGTASRLTFRSLDRNSGELMPLSLRATLEYQSSRFLPVDSSSIENPYGLRTDVQLLKRIRRDLTGSLSHSYSFGRASTTDMRSSSLDLSWQPRAEWQIGFTVTNAVETRAEQTVFLNLTYFDFEKGRSVVGRYSSPQDASRIEFQKHAGSGLNDWQATAGLERNRSVDQVDANALYRGLRADLGVQHRSVLTHDPTFASSRSTSLNWGTALVFTDQAVGWSRPVQDSFAILPKRSSDLEGVDVAVNRFDEKPQAIANRFGPAVLSSVSSYNDSPVIFDVASMPPGLKPTSEFNVARPAYRGGVTIPIETSGQVAVVAILHGESGEPLSLVSGRIEKDKAGQPSGEVVGEFFTNSKGRLLIESIVRGYYWLIPYDRGGARIKLNVPQDARGLVKIKDVLKLEVPR